MAAQQYPYGLVPESGETLTVSGYSQFTAPSSIGVPEAVLTIQQLGLPYEISTKAVELFYELESNMGKQVHPVKSLRTKRKTRRVFLCVFLAYNELGLPKDPAAIAELTHLDHSEIEHAFNESPVNIVIDPIKLSQYYIQQINQFSPDMTFNVDVVKAEIGKIIEICKRTKIGRETLNNSPAKHIAVGTICFYITEMVMVPVQRTTFERACHLSWACISKYCREISTLYNSKPD